MWKTGTDINESVGSHQKVGPCAADETQGIIAGLHVLPEVYLHTENTTVEILESCGLGHNLKEAH